MFLPRLQIFLCLFFILHTFTSWARPIDEGLQKNMNDLLEEDYDNMANMWDLANEYYNAYNEFDTVECLDWASKKSATEQL